MSKDVMKKDNGSGMMEKDDGMMKRTGSNLLTRHQPVGPSKKGPACQVSGKHVASCCGPMTHSVTIAGAVASRIVNRLQFPGMTDDCPPAPCFDVVSRRCLAMVRRP
jgi:hypothetical protein